MSLVREKMSQSSNDMLKSANKSGLSHTLDNKLTMGNSIAEVDDLDINASENTFRSAVCSDQAAIEPLNSKTLANDLQHLNFVFETNYLPEENSCTTENISDAETIANCCKERSANEISSKTEVVTDGSESCTDGEVEENKPIVRTVHTANIGASETTATTNHNDNEITLQNNSTQQSSTEDIVIGSVDKPSDRGLRHRKVPNKLPNTENVEVLENWEKEKVRKILAELRAPTCSKERLKQFAISKGGLVTNEVRRLAWTKLLDVDTQNITDKPSSDVLHSHRDYQQVVLDVNRSLKRFPPGMEEDVRLSMQDQLVDCIMRVLCARQELHYYQGYHDIVVTFLLVTGEDLTFAIMNDLSMEHLRDFMYESMDKTTGMLHYLYPLLGKSNRQLRDFMEQAEVGTIFALAWLITWFGHVLGDIKNIVRLYDFFIACHPLMPIYLAAVVVLYRSDEIFCCEPEMPIIHSLLSKIPPDLPIEKLISEAGDLFLMYPPESVEKEAKQQYQLYLEENERKREQLKQMTRARGRGQHRRSQSWWAGRFGGHSVQKSALIKVTVWTGAALLSAAALTLYWSKSGVGDCALDFHSLWGS